MADPRTIAMWMGAPNGERTGGGLRCASADVLDRARSDAAQLPDYFRGGTIG